MFWFITTIIVVVFNTHWAASTPLKRNAAYQVLNTRNPWNAHNFTALIYLAGAVYAALQSQIDMTLLLLGTFLSSSWYHLSHESTHFNLDFLFAAALGFIFVWTMYLAAPLDWKFEVNSVDNALLHSFQVTCTPNLVHTQVGLLGMPLGLLLFVGCGAPCEIIPVKGPLPVCFCRGESTIYNWIHPLWHIVSGCAPLLCIHYFANHCTDSPHAHTMGIAPLFENPGLPTVPIYSLGTALIINIMANAAGIMPLQ